MNLPFPDRKSTRISLLIEISNADGADLLRDIAEFVRARGHQAIGPGENHFDRAQNFGDSAIEDVNLTKALKYIRERACEGLQIDQVATFAGISRSVLQRRFRAAFNETVHDIVIQVRLERARELLANTNLSLAEVAEKSGFKHGEYLGAVFKKKFGRTPAQFRKASGTSVNQRGVKNWTNGFGVRPEMNFCSDERAEFFVRL